MLANANAFRRHPEQTSLWPLRVSSHSSFSAFTSPLFETRVYRLAQKQSRKASKHCKRRVNLQICVCSSSQSVYSITRTPKTYTSVSSFFFFYFFACASSTWPASPQCLIHELPPNTRMYSILAPLNILEWKAEYIYYMFCFTIKICFNTLVSRLKTHYATIVLIYREIPTFWYFILFVLIYILALWIAFMCLFLLITLEDLRAEDIKRLAFVIILDKNVSRLCRRKQTSKF